MTEDTKPLVQAALFISSEPLNLEELKEITDSDKGEVRESLEEIRSDFQSDEHGIELFKTSDG